MSCTSLSPGKAGTFEQGNKQPKSKAMSQASLDCTARNLFRYHRATVAVTGPYRFQQDQNTTGPTMTVLESRRSCQPSSVRSTDKIKVVAERGVIHSRSPCRFDVCMLPHVQPCQHTCWFRSRLCPSLLAGTQAGLLHREQVMAEEGNFSRQKKPRDGIHVSSPRT